MKYNVGSLFAGVGGVCLGFKRASDSYNLVVANEMDDMAIITYKRNFNHTLVQGDIQKILNPQLIDKEIKFLKERHDKLGKQIENKEKIHENIKLFSKIIKNKIETYLDKVLYGNEEFSLPNNFDYKDYEKNKILLVAEYYVIDSILTIRDITWKENIKKHYEEKRKQMLAKRIDILTGGFPCQAFSIAGGRKGFLDHRGELFYSIIELVKQLEGVGHGKPRILFLENVKNLVNHDNGITFKVIKSEIEKLGYKIKSKVLNTCDYTKLPQNRERIFIICFLKQEDYENFEGFSEIKKLTFSRLERQEDLKGILEYNSSAINLNEFYYTKEKYPLYYSEENLERNIETQITEMYEIYQIRRGMYIRKNQSGVCPTLTANMGTGGHNVPLIKVSDGIRKLIPRECFDLQGFGVKTGQYSLPEIPNAELYKQAGNAVSVDIVEILAKKILATLEKKENFQKESKKNIEKAHISDCQKQLKEKQEEYTKDLCKNLIKFNNNSKRDKNLTLDEKIEIIKIQKMNHILIGKNGKELKGRALELRVEKYF